MHWVSEKLTLYIFFLIQNGILQNSVKMSDLQLLVKEREDKDQYTLIEQSTHVELSQ